MIWRNDASYDSGYVSEVSFASKKFQNNVYLAPSKYTKPLSPGSLDINN